MRALWPKDRSRRGYIGLIAMMAALLIVAILAVVILLPRMNRARPGSTDAKSMPEAAMEKGREVECMQNLRSIRDAIVMHRTENESPPASLKDLKMGVGPDFFKCPVGKEDYAYDPNTGTVRCVHPGHEKF